MTDTSQRLQILRTLKSGKAITPIEALRKFGCFRLGARVYELKQQGHNIKNVWAEDEKGRRFAKYKMEKAS